MVLMRMLRTVVRDRLHEWTFAEDDHLDGNAELIWKVGGIDEDLNGFHVGGVPLDELEVFDSHTGSWTRWHDSPDTRLDAERLSAVGWSPIAIETRQGGSGTAYWAAIPELSHRPTERGYWCVITLDESVPGTLGGEPQPAVVEFLVAQHQVFLGDELEVQHDLALLAVGQVPETEDQSLGARAAHSYLRRCRDVRRCRGRDLSCSGRLSGLGFGRTDDVLSLIHI